PRGGSGGPAPASARVLSVLRHLRQRLGSPLVLVLDPLGARARGTTYLSPCRVLPKEEVVLPLLTSQQHGRDRASGCDPPDLWSANRRSGRQQQMVNRRRRLNAPLCSRRESARDRHSVGQ